MSTILRLPITERLGDHLDTLTSQYRRAALKLFAGEREIVTGLFARVESADDLVAISQALKSALTSADGYLARRWVEEFARLDAQVIDLAATLDAIPGLAFGLDANMVQSIALTAYERADALATHVGETTAANISDAVYEAINTGQDAAALIASSAYDTDMTLTRAEMIARTELHGTLVQGEYEAVSEAGVMSEKEWLHSGNQRAPRDWHVAMDGERVALDDLFSNGLVFPGDPDGDAEEVINCGCGVLYFD